MAVYCIYPLRKCAVPLLLSSGVRVAKLARLGYRRQKSPERWLRDWNLACSEQVSSSVQDSIPQGEVQSRSTSIILAAREVLCIPSSWCGHGWAVPGSRKVSATRGCQGAGVASQSHSTLQSCPGLRSHPRTKASLPALAGHLQVSKNGCQDGHGPNQLEDEGHGRG